MIRAFAGTPRTRPSGRHPPTSSARFAGTTDTSRSLLNGWFNTPHLLEQADAASVPFEYFFAQREAIETIIYLVDVIGAKDKHDLMRFDSSGYVSGAMFSETWRRCVVKMATGSGKTKVLSLALAWSFFHRLYEPGSEMSRKFLVITPNPAVRRSQNLRVGIDRESAKGRNSCLSRFGTFAFS